jgi:S1-C subfamily serine protease
MDGARRAIVPARVRARGLTRSLGARLRAVRLGGGRRFWIALSVVLLTLLAAGAAYAVTSALVGGGSKSPAAAATSRPWLGIDVSSTPIGGVTVVGVTPGSPAAAAGLQPGDGIVEVGGQQVASPSDITSAIAGMRPGDHVLVVFQRGPATYTAHVVLGTRPPGYP